MTNEQTCSLQMSYSLYSWESYRVGGGDDTLLYYEIATFNGSGQLARSSVQAWTVTKWRSRRQAGPLSQYLTSGWIQPICEYCMVGSYALLSVCPSVCPCHWTIINISEVSSGIFPFLTFSRTYCSYEAETSLQYNKIPITRSEILVRVHLITLVPTPLWEKIMSANRHGIFALTGRAHCQRQVAFL